MAFPDRELRARCERFLSGHPQKSQRAWLEELAAAPGAELERDFYGDGPALAALEREVAEILGKEAGVFVHKGVVAQLMALRVWAERTGKWTVALHPKSHIDLDERGAYESVLGMRGLRVGRDIKPFSVRDLEDLHEPLGSIVVELPLRRAGYKLPTWEELVAISTWAREQGIPLHFDGARLWESAPFYGRSYAEISALADSVYVSLYKGLGGMAGCVLAGSADFIAETRAWQTRLGSNIFTVFPYVLAAQEGLKQHLPKMPGYVEGARRIAAELVAIPGVRLNPDPPQTNAFQIYLPYARPLLERACLELAERQRLWLFNYFEETAFPDLMMGEITVGESTEQWTPEEVAAAMRSLLELAAGYK